MTEEVKAPEVKAEVKPVTSVGNEKSRMTRNTPAPAKKPAPIKAVPDPARVVMADKPIEPEKPHASVPHKLPASVLAEQEAGRAALARRK